MVNGSDVVMEGEGMEDHQSAGFRLRCAREQWSLSIREVAGALNLLASHVRAIEANRCNALANDDQFLRHLRDYANLMLLDANDVERTYHAQSVVLTEHVQERPTEDTKRHHGTWVGVGGIAIIFACVGTGSFRQTLPINTGNTHPGNSAPLAVGAEPLVGITQHANAAQAPTVAIPRPKHKGVAKPLHSNAWFATLEPDRYTLQLLSFTREESSRAFIQRRHLQEDAAYFAVENDDGETWYAVTYGLFDSYEVALSSIRTLPDRISDLKPRVRNTGRIQDIMRP